MKIHDLSMPITKDHFRWSVARREAGDWSVGHPFRTTTLDLPCHCFTHVDARRHMLPDGESIDETPLTDVTGPAFVVDLCDVEPEAAIGAERLDAALASRGDESILLVRTGWDTRRSWADPAYWLDAPYVTRDGAERLAAARPAAVAFDFPQDYTIRLSLDGIVPPIEKHVTHDVLLRRGVTLVEYLVNATAIASPVVYLSALPLKVQGGDGAPARVVAFED